jgi:hypothetical protein
MQGLHAALVIGAGPMHRHGLAQAGHSHGGFERHLHAPGDTSVQAAPANADAGTADAAAAALAAALALLALGGVPVLLAAPGRRHVLRAARTGAWRSLTAPPPLRPPRAA